MASPNERFAAPIPQEKIPGQGKLTIPRVEVDRTRIQPYVIDINLGGTNVAPIANLVPSPYKANIDWRTRHLRIINDGAATIVGPPPTGDLFWTWGQPQPGSRGVLHPGDEILYDDLFFEFPTLYLEIADPAVVGATGVHLLIYGW